MLADICQCCRLLIFVYLPLFETLSMLNLVNKDSESESDCTSGCRTTCRYSEMCLVGRLHAGSMGRPDLLIFCVFGSRLALVTLADV